MLEVWKLIQPTVDIVSVLLEEFDLGEKSWRNPFEARLSLSKKNSLVDRLGTHIFPPLLVSSLLVSKYRKSHDLEYNSWLRWLDRIFKVAQ